MAPDAADVAILGGGLAGLAAAIRCAELGLRPLVCVTLILITLHTGNAHHTPA